MSACMEGGGKGWGRGGEERGNGWGEEGGRGGQRAKGRRAKGRGGEETERLQPIERLQPFQNSGLYVCLRDHETQSSAGKPSQLCIPSET